MFVLSWTSDTASVLEFLGRDHIICEVNSFKSVMHGIGSTIS